MKFKLLEAGHYRADTEVGAFEIFHEGSRNNGWWVMIGPSGYSDKARTKADLLVHCDDAIKTVKANVAHLENVDWWLSRVGDSECRAILQKCPHPVARRNEMGETLLDYAEFILRNAPRQREPLSVVIREAIEKAQKSSSES